MNRRGSKLSGRRWLLVSISEVVGSTQELVVIRLPMFVVLAGVPITLKPYASKQANDQADNQAEQLKHHDPPAGQ
jgi:hypothetical protein